MKPKRFKRKTGSVIGLVFTLLIIAGFILRNTDLFKQKPESSKPITDGECSVHFVDVGQGDSIIISCGGKNVLIDAGENNKGDEVLLKLDKLGIDKLDYVIGTHAHSDHIGGLDTVISSIEVENIILSDLPDDMVPTTKTYEDLIDVILEKEINVIPAEVYDSFEIGEAKLTIISPATDEYKDLNEWSIVTKLEYGENSFLFTGDAEESVEKDILKAGTNVSADVLKVGHHGSRTSSCKEFLNKVKPSVAVITVGEGNSYDHPHDEALSALEEIGAKIYRTDLNGDISVISDGKELEINCEIEEE